MGAPVSPVGAGLVRLTVPASPLGLGSVPLRGERSRRRGRASWGALSRAGLAGGDGASRGPGGEARALRLSRALGVCQFLETSRPGAGSERRDRLGVGVGSSARVFRGRRVSWFPARRAPALWSFSHPAAGVQVEPGSGFSGWATLGCSGGRPEPWTGRGHVPGDGNKVGEASKHQPFHWLPSPCAPVASQCVV